MNPAFRKQLLREFPELAAGYHLPIMAEIITIPDAPKTGGINDSYRPRLAVDVVLLDTHYTSTGIVLEAVPVAIIGGGDERGFFALPQKNTLVEIAWLNGSPERPFIRSILGDRQTMPGMDSEDMTWQQSNQVKQSVDKSGTWTRETNTTIKDKSFTHELEAHKKIETLGQEIKRVLEHSLEDIDGIKQIEAGAIHQLSLSVFNMLSLGSINQVAGEHITRSANKNIIDHATANIEQTAAKFYLGTETDNLLKLISDSLQGVIDSLTSIATLTVICPPSGPSSVPVNAADFTTKATELNTLKTAIDGMTK